MSFPIRPYNPLGGTTRFRPSNEEPDSTERRYNSSASSDSSTSSSDYEYLNLFHKLDHLQRSPLAGMYNMVVHSSPNIVANSTVSTPSVSVGGGDDKEAGRNVSSPTITVTSPPLPPTPPPTTTRKPQERQALPSNEPLSPPTIPQKPIQSPSPASQPEVHVIAEDTGEEMTPVPNQRPYVEITEQPHPKALRFRYECEGRSAGSIPGVNTTNDQKTFPSIQIHNYRGRAVVVVSCVTKEGPDHKPHPHNLVGKEGCKKGVCTVEINSTTMSYTFNNLGIQCVKKKDVADALKLRQEIRVDPFRTGFDHAKEPGSIDLNAVRLCFQVFLEGAQRGRFTEPLTPVVSDIIYDKKAMSDLIICRLSDCTAPVSGGKEIILLCEKVVKEDIKVRFFEMKGSVLVWENYAEFSHTDVHKQVAISFRTPPYKSMDIRDPVRVHVQLERPSDNTYSEARDFQFSPLDSGRRRFSALHRELMKNPSSDSPENQLFKRILLEGSNRSVLEQQMKPLNGPALRTESEVIVLDTPNVENKPFVAETVSSDQKTTEWIQRNEFNNGNTIGNGGSSGDDNQMVTGDTNNNIFQSNAFDLPDGTNNSTDENANGLAPVATAAPAAAGSAAVPDDDQTLKELLEQVAELDEIYTDHQLRRENLMLEQELKTLEQTVPVQLGSPGGQPMDIDEVFDDAATYTSLQRAFKNPLSITLGPPIPPRPADHARLDAGVYDAVEPLHVPTIDVTSHKRDSQELEKLPPLPPKRAKPSVQNKENTALDANDEVLLNTIIRKGSMRSLAPRPQSDQIIIMKTPDSPLNKKLPPTPPSSPSKGSVAASPGGNGAGGDFNTLPKNKKPGFFSKLFSRKKSKSDLTASTNTLNRKNAAGGSKEPSLTVDFEGKESPQRKGSLRDSSGEKRKAGKPVARSVSSVSARRPASDASPDYIYIPLKGDGPTGGMQSRNGGSGTHLSLPGNDSYERASTASLPPLDRKAVSALQLDVPIQDGNLELVAIADARSIKNLVEGNYGVQLDPNVDLTEAEHFALYTSIAPNAALNPRRKRQKLVGSSNVFLPIAPQLAGPSQPSSVGMPGNIPNLSQLDATGGLTASTSGLPRGIYNYHNTSAFPQMTKEEIKNEPADSPNHIPSNQYQLQPMQMLTSTSTSPGPDRIPATLTPSPGIGGPISPLDPDNVTPTPPAYTTLGSGGGGGGGGVGGGTLDHMFCTFGTGFGDNTTNPPQNTGGQMFDTNLSGPSNGWVQPVQSLNGPNQQQQQSFSLGNFSTHPLAGDPLLGTPNTIPASITQPNVGPLTSLGSDLNFDVGSLEPTFNSSEFRMALGSLSTTELNRLEQAANLQRPGSYQQSSVSNQQLNALLATQQQQQMHGQGQTLPDRNDNDEDLTDSFTKLSTNDLN